MTKPVFGKWTRVEDGLPEQDGAYFVWAYLFDETFAIKEAVYYKRFGWKTLEDYDLEVHKWMPLPKAGQDAFTELRALLEEAEKDNREKYPDESMMKFILERMREVIE